MKHLVFAAAILVGAALPAKADVRFIGGFVTTSVVNCAYTTVGEQRAARYRPPGEAGNPSGGGLITIDLGDSYTVEFPAPHPALNTFQNVSSVEAGAFGFDVYATKIKLTAKSPATITAGTRTVFLRGIIEEPFGEKFSPGLCTVGFEASFVRGN
jgi:hypothetical protein